MKNFRQELFTISEDILDTSKSEKQLQTACRALFNWYLEVHNTEDFTGTETVLEHGLALSPQDAAECILDYKRTVVFIRAIKQALEDQLEIHAEAPIDILYSGTGPCGTLLIPILHLFSPQRIQVTILDIHGPSVDYLTKIIQLLQYEDYIMDCVVNDAIKHEFKDGNKFDVIINETLYEGLTKEPQVNVTKNLMHYLKEDGLFIPQNIAVSAGCAFFAKEPYVWFNTNDYHVNNPDVVNRPRIHLGPIFALNKATFSQLSEELKSQKFKLPETYKEFPDIVIFTEVDVYKQYTLRECESTISNIHGVASIPNFQDKSFIELIYVADNHPKWEYLLS